MGMGLEKAYATLKNSPPMTDKVVNNPASPYQGVATLAQQFQAQANQTPTPIPMQSALQQQQAQQQQPTTFAKGKTVSAKSPDHAIEQNIQKLFGANVPPKLKALLKKGTANFLSTGKPNPKYLREVLAEVAKLPQEVQAKYAPKIAEIKAILAKSSKGVASLAKGGDVKVPESWEEDAIMPENWEDDVAGEVIPEGVDSPDNPSKLGRDAAALASLYKNEGLSPKMAEMMQLAQEGKMRQGLGSVIGAALTGAATPHALQSGQASAMMAGEAADKGVASLNAGQDMMMAKAAEMEGAPVKNYNTALGQILASQVADKKYRAALAAAQLKGNNALQVAEKKGEINKAAATVKHGYNLELAADRQAATKELQVAKLASNKELAALRDKTLRDIAKSKAESVDKMTGAQNANVAMQKVDKAQESFYKDYANIGKQFPVAAYYEHYLTGAPLGVAIDTLGN